MIFHIQRFSLHDGDGVRTLVFFKGCTLRCTWCSNPESQSFEPALMYDARLCRGFGDCIKAAPGAIEREKQGGVSIRRDQIREPGRLRDVCAAGALTVCGEPMDTGDLLKEIEKDLPFYREDGGVTLTGGEPLARGSDLIHIMKQLKARKIDVSIETSLHVDWKNIRECIGLADLFLADLKHVDPVKFREYTGGDARLIMANLRKLTFSGAPVIIRIPVIPGFNHTEKEIDRILRFVSSLQCIRELHFLPFHQLGMEKYRMLDRAYAFKRHPQVSREEIYPYAEMAGSMGFNVKIGG